MFMGPFSMVNGNIFENIQEHFKLHGDFFFLFAGKFIFIMFKAECKIFTGTFTYLITRTFSMPTGEKKAHQRSFTHFKKFVFFFLTQEIVKIALLNVQKFDSTF